MQIKRCASKYAKVGGKKKIQMKEEPFLHMLHYPMNIDSAAKISELYWSGEALKTHQLLLTK